MSKYVLDFQEIDRTQLSQVGGKGANLGELSKIEGIRVPDGFCVTTEAYLRAVKNAVSLEELLNQLTDIKIDDRERISNLSSKLRKALEEITIPQDIQDEITHHLAKLAGNHLSYAFAIRSSATAEDLPTASFAGQQDTFLNRVGLGDILKHIIKCWASLFNERAIVYRLQNGFNHHDVSLAVVVQKMVNSEVSGVMFTADPLTSNRKVVSIEASFGLGEVLVSGRAHVDRYKVRCDEIIERQIANKELAIYAIVSGGTKEQSIAVEKQNKQTLTDAQILQIEHAGRAIEKHFSTPQDIEWCLSDNAFFIVQSRPITTLFPIPEVNDQENHVYISVGHQQMMTDAMKPLGISFWQMTAARPMFTAGGRLFVDVYFELASPVRRAIIVEVLGQDPLIKDALMNILGREDFITSSPSDSQHVPNQGNQVKPPVNYKTLQNYDPSVVADLIKHSETSLEELKRNIQSKSGNELLDFIFEDVQQLKKSLSDPQSFGVIMTGMNASTWLNEKIEAWLGEVNVADTLSQSVPHNITSEMGLSLLDVADVIRPYSEVVTYLQHTHDDNYLDKLARFTGGPESRDAIQTYLNKYGMRCAGEIDITKPRWSENPLLIVPIILSNIRNFEPNASKRRFEHGRLEAEKKEQEIVDKLRQQPDSEEKVEEMQHMIRLIRNLIGYREYPKYNMMRRYFVYKKSLLEEAERLVQVHVLQNKEDIFYLSFQEIQDIERTQKIDQEVVNKRKSDYIRFEKISPPRVLTSDGEVVTGTYKREHLPAQALIGLPVSSGTIEGRARVIFNIGDANFEEGDILVTTFTDPSWTPLFLSIKGLVTEVGVVMTHGSVIAREYGLPAVVGVENATKLINDGERIRVNGTEGYVEIF